MMNHTYRDKICYFNELSPRWDEVVGNDESRTAQLREVFSLISIKAGDTVIDAGCGTGILFPLIEEHIGPEGTIIAIDAASKMLEEAKKKHASVRNIRYLVSTLEDAALLPKSADAILCFAVFPHIEDKAQALAKCREALKENGMLYIFHLSDTKSLNEFHHNLEAPVRHDCMPERDELEELFSRTRFRLTRYIDRPQLNFVEAQAV